MEGGRIDIGDNPSIWVIGRWKLTCGMQRRHSESSMHNSRREANVTEERGHLGYPRAESLILEACGGEGEIVCNEWILARGGVGGDIVLEAVGVSGFVVDISG